MTTADLVQSILQQLGIVGLFLIVAVAVLRPFLESWLNRRIEAGVEEGLRKRLAAFQHDLDKDLERHRSALSAEVQRGTIDFGIYAAKRHEALTTLFADFLRAEVLITDMSDLTPPPTEEVDEDALVDWLDRARVPAPIKTEALDLLGRRDFPRLGPLLSDLTQAARKARALRARNDAYEAYFRQALYLPREVDAAAIAVRDHFHTAALPYVLSDDPRAQTDIVRNKTRLRFLMLEYQNAARADLARVATVRERRLYPPPKHRRTTNDAA